MALKESMYGVLATLVAGLLLAGVWFHVPGPLTPLVAVGGIAVLIVAIEAPIVTALLFIALSLFRLHEAFPLLNPFRLPLVFGIATLAALSWHALALQRFRAHWPKELRLFVVFFAVTSFGCVFALNHDLAFDAWSSAFVKIALMTLAIAWIVGSERDYRLASFIFVACGGALAVVAIANWISGVDIVEGTRVAIGSANDSSLSDPNDLALVLLFPLAFTLVGLRRGASGPERAVTVAVMLLLLFAIWLAQSRGGLLGAGAVLLAFMVQSVRSRGLIAVTVLIGAIAVIPVAGLLNRPPPVAGAELDESAEGRLAAWRAGVNMAFARPVTGVGLNNFSAHFYYYTDDFRGRDLSPHSTWFGVLGETGWPGFLVFMAFVIAVLRSAVRSRRQLCEDAASAYMRAFAASLVAALVGFCVSGTFLAQGFAWPLYILAGLTASLSRFARQSGSEPIDRERCCMANIDKHRAGYGAGQN